MKIDLKRFFLIVFISLFVSSISIYVGVFLMNGTNKPNENGELALGDANNNLFNSIDTKYDNSNSGLSSTNVQNAIDELYGVATNYSVYDTRLQGAEDKTGSTSLNTTAQNISGAVNETKNKLALVTTDITSNCTTTSGTLNSVVERKYGKLTVLLISLSNATKTRFTVTCPNNYGTMLLYSTRGNQVSNDISGFTTALSIGAFYSNKAVYFDGAYVDGSDDSFNGTTIKFISFNAVFLSN